MDNQSTVISSEDHLYCSPLRRYLYAREGELPTEEQIVAMEAMATGFAEGVTTTKETPRSVVWSFRTATPVTD